MARVPDPLQNVGINALFLDPGRSGGPETYLRELVSALVQEAPLTRVTIVTTRRGAAGLVEDGWRERATIVALPADEGERVRRQVAEQLLLPRLARRRGFDVLHSLASVAPIRAGVPSVITLHDTTFFTHRTFDVITTFGMRFVVSQAAAHADALLTASAAARDDICRDLAMAPERFVVVPHGLGRPRTGGATSGWRRSASRSSRTASGARAPARRPRRRSCASGSGSTASGS
jgi:glycosyltransferase involved in cell wall biosynthesis